MVNGLLMGLKWDHNEGLFGADNRLKSLVWKAFQALAPLGPSMTIVEMLNNDTLNVTLEALEGPHKVSSSPVILGWPGQGFIWLGMLASEESHI